MIQANKPADLFEKYEEHREKLKEFIKSFVDPNMMEEDTTEAYRNRKYMNRLVRIRS